MTDVDACGVTFRFPDDDDRVVAVRLLQEVRRDAGDHPFQRTGAGWELRFDRPAVDRFEYRFELEWAGGGREARGDPSNPLRASGAFGERSVVEFPGYHPPAWTCTSPPAGTRTEHLLDGGLLGEPQPALLWSPPGTAAGDELPLLVALDGLELDRYSSITLMLDSLSWSGELPPMRALLLHPTRRDHQYSADPEFPAALAGVIDEVAKTVAPCPDSPAARIGLGASLGALAVLHAHHERPSLFGGLFLQSGSFLRHAHLQGFEHLGRLEAFVEEVLAGGSARPAQVEMTCGAVEENLPDNRAMAAALRVDGWRAHLHVLPDAHNWVAWRDGWTPHLVELICGLWRHAA